jgi:hypothetical protein
MAPRRANLDPMDGVISLSNVREDRFWAVIASVGRNRRIAEIFSSREAALADRAWREAQIKAYAGFLRSSRQPPPNYSVVPMKRSELPKAWRPLPALGFLRGQFI